MVFGNGRQQEGKRELLYQTWESLAMLGQKHHARNSVQILQ
jgi:hypothetical protein